MKNTINIAIIPEMTLEPSVVNDMPSVTYITFDLMKLIEEPRSITDLINEHRCKLGFSGLMLLADWLYNWYKKIAKDQRVSGKAELILTNRILNSFDYAFHNANNMRY
jgi:hypothetical protein